MYSILADNSGMSVVSGAFLSCDLALFVMKVTTG